MRTDLAADVAALLAVLEQAPPVVFREMSIDDLREAAHELTRQLDAPADHSVAAQAATIDNGDDAIALRLYTPPVCRDDAPVILYIHGGGWVTGGLDSHDSFCRFLARYSELRVASVDYRLAPEAPFPAAFEDVMAAAHWLAGGESAFGPVTGLVLAGDSAGGGLAAALATSGAGSSLSLRALLLFYPALDLKRRAPSYAEFSQGYLLSAADMEFFIDSYAPDVGQRADPRCSPLLAYDVERLPPVAVLTCSHDVLRDEGRALIAACRAAGTPCAHVEASGYIHGMVTMRKAVPSVTEHIANIIDKMNEIMTK